MKQKHIAVIGCGPAGLMAAHGVSNAGHAVEILTDRKQPSEIHGAQYVHAWIPRLVSINPDFEITYRKIGTGEGYAKKIYGDPDRPTSWDKVFTDSGPQPAWSMRKTYERLWERYAAAIEVDKIMPTDVNVLLAEYDMVISTAPRPALCVQPEIHEFGKRRIYISNYGGLEHMVNENEIVYSGDVQHRWYRVSKLGGYFSMESAQPIPGAGCVEGFKVTGTTCDCHPRLIKLGRFGRWEPGVLTHHAYVAAFRAVTIEFGVCEEGLQSEVIN